MKEAALRFKRPVNSISAQAMNHLMTYKWPGNIRELKNTIERSVLITDGDTVTLKALPNHVTEIADRPAAAAGEPQLQIDLIQTLRNVERQLILNALEQAEGVQRKAAELLGITERVLWYKIKKLQIDVACEPSELGASPLENDAESVN